MASSKRTDAPGTSTGAASGATTGAASGARTGAPPGATERAGTQDGLSGSEAAARSLNDALRCDLLMNARYHASREAFLDTVHRVLMFLIIVLGAAGVTDLLGSSSTAHLIKGIFGACAVVFAAIDLTVDLSNRARCHALMKRRYFEMLADLITNKQILDVEALMHRCCADEEPAFHALLASCWNSAQEMVYGQYADAYQIPWWHKKFQNLVRFGRKYDVVAGPRPSVATLA
jgi:hypothetical protein